MHLCIPAPCLRTQLAIACRSRAPELPACQDPNSYPCSPLSARSVGGCGRRRRAVPRPDGHAGHPAGVAARAAARATAGLPARAEGPHAALLESQCRPEVRSSCNVWWLQQLCVCLCVRGSQGVTLLGLSCASGAALLGDGADGTCFAMQRAGVLPAPVALKPAASWPAPVVRRPTAEQIVEDLRQQLMALRPAPHAAPPRPPLPPHAAPAPAAQPAADAA